MNFLSACYWDIEHTDGTSPADIYFVYQKTNVNPDMDDPTFESYVLHYDGASWQNITPEGTVTTDNWNGDFDFYVTSVSGVDDFSPFAPSGTFGIPTLTEWAAIVLGSLFVIVGGWFVWRRVV